MSIILLIVLLVSALINLHKAKTATPANRAMKRNEAKILLSCAALVAGDLLLSIAIAPFATATFGWIIVLLLIVAAFALMVGGIVMAMICIKRMRSIYQQIFSEANPWASRP
jgi:hypothetical protein